MTNRLLSVLLVVAVAACGGGVTLEDDSATVDASTSTIVTLAPADATTSTGEGEPDDEGNVTSTTGDREGASDVNDEPAKEPERVPTDEVPPDLLAAIVAHAAGRAGVAAADVVVSMARAVQWPDASLGCPQPGMAYAQVVTAGYHVQVSAGGSVHDYRADASGSFFVCEEAIPIDEDDLPGDEGIDPPPPES
jgi:hypothetical protein